MSLIIFFVVYGLALIAIGAVARDIRDAIAKYHARRAQKKGMAGKPPPRSRYAVFKPD